MLKLSTSEIANLEHLATSGNQSADALVKMLKNHAWSATFSVAAATGGHIDTTLQLVNMEGKPFGAQHTVEVWVSDTAGAGPTAQSTLTTTIQTGTTIVTTTANKVYRVVTDTTGKAVIRIADTGKSYYLNVNVDGLVSSSVIAL